jgi:hypothetical protein
MADTLAYPRTVERTLAGKAVAPFGNNFVVGNGFLVAHEGTPSPHEAAIIRKADRVTALTKLT